MIRFVARGCVDFATLVRPLLSGLRWAVSPRSRSRQCSSSWLLLWALITSSTLVTGLGCQRSSPAVDAAKPPTSTSTHTVVAKDVAVAKDAVPVKDTVPAKDAVVAKPSAPGPAEGKQPATATPTGAQLFARHCASCHGERGDGKGIAAAFLFPRPRDFTTGRFRLVSASNNVPTRDDIQAVLVRGMPGSAMPPWAHLSQSDRDALVDEVLRLRTAGVREAYIRQLKDEEGLSDEKIAAPEVQKSIQDYVNNLAVPGEVRPVPTIGPPTAEAIARGKENYAKFVCISCHGETGRGDGVQAMNDDDGTPTSPRDFTLGIFKGNPDPASLYRRIAFGMPGTPMPASTAMTPEQMVDLVHYIRSQSTEEQRQAAVLKREKIVAQRVSSIPGSESAEAWSSVKSVPLRTTTLWWRADASADFAVQAVHDGTTLAVRFSWQDATEDQQAWQSESFKDAAALELYQGDSEPFLGMGSLTAPVDVWFWDADRQNGQLAVEKLHPNAVTDVYPFSEAAVTSAELTRAGARLADQPDISLPARAVGNQIVPRNAGSGGSSLTAGGPRTVTFRPPQSQLVQAKGTWQDGRWTVVMTRPLAVAASAGDRISLEPGGRASLAFALWDGGHRDRNGQKSITIWQDFELER